LNKLQAETVDWLTKEGVRARLGLPSTRIVEEMMRKRKIPFVKLGHKTVRFHWPNVEAALAKLEIHEAGRK
jgi:hypothetical protein